VPVQHQIDSDAQHPQSSHEDLGTDTVDGVLVRGQRTTITYPAGSQGNDRAFSVVHEYWRAPDLNLQIVTKTDDPRSGVHTRKLVNINRSEPDAALFQPPPDYTVKDETGEFTITYSLPQR
jgi:hypothetical protein